jgi:hypothetical protein
LLRAGKRGSANGANGPRMRRAAIREHTRRHVWRNSRTLLGFGMGDGRAFARMREGPFFWGRDLTDGADACFDNGTGLRGIGGGCRIRVREVGRGEELKDGRAFAWMREGPFFWEEISRTARTLVLRTGGLTGYRLTLPDTSPRGRRRRKRRGRDGGPLRGCVRALFVAGGGKGEKAAQAQVLRQATTGGTVRNGREQRPFFPLRGARHPRKNGAFG